MLYKDLIKKYKRKLEKKLGRDTKTSQAMSYSRAYQIFKQEQTSDFHSFYETACNFSEKLLKIKVPPKDQKKVEPFLKLAHISATPKGVYSFAYFTTILVIIFSMIFSLLFMNLIIVLIGLIVAIGFLLYLPRLPKQIFMSWRSKAADQLVLAVLYLVIYVKHTSNLERAIRFVSEHMPPPISIDFMKILWDVETKKYSSIKESLDAYLETWRDWDREFVESIQLVESSFAEPSKKRKEDILDKAVNVILNGTQDHMIHFAHQLQSPIQSLHMLGVVLPVMGMVMLPMIGAFMGASIKWYYLVLLYNIILPVSVYAIGKSVLSTRPAGSDQADVYEYLQKKYAKPFVTVLGRKLKISPAGLGMTVFVLIALPAVFYFISLLGLTGEALRDAIFSNISVYLSVVLIAAVGFGLATYYWFSIAHLIKLKRTIEKMEKEFSSGIFQLGNRLLEHVPAEVAFARVANTMKKSDISKFFATVDYNIRRLGVGLRDAIFNQRYGALAYFPSATIKSMMAVLIESIKKGPEIAGRSLITISKYLTSVHKVTERLKDLLADTVSSMQMQVKLFVPMISGIVVGLAVLTTTIMINLGKQMAGLEAPGTGTAAPGAGLLDIFQIQFMTPGFVFQLLVGIYLIQIVFILSTLLSGIINGHDEIERKYAIARNLFISTALYVIITVAVVLIFTGLAAPITQIVT
ncbi:hypothetical protein GF374_02235 [Candidatus Woesearchaeota archaeon]|nr:hypothetical protein [Candidatus Woesearchaeota archaeon]